MKSTVALLVAAVAAAAAQPHRHQHQHLHEKKDMEPNGAHEWVTVPGPTEVVYVLNGQAISEADVQEGIKNGTLVWAAGGQLSKSSSSAAATSTPAPAYTPSSSTSQYMPPPTTSSSSSAQYVPPPPSSSPAPASSSSAAPSPSSSSSPAPAPSSGSANKNIQFGSQSGSGNGWGPPSSSGNGWGPSSSSGSSGSGSDFNHDSATGVNTPFPDGTIDCGTFPSDYGALAVSWMGLGGWTGVQNPGSSAGGFSNIETIVSSLCLGGNCCSEGSYCSYACPAGYQKSQWPDTQGSTGQSVGGLLCKNGKLHLTNPDMSKNLCMTGTDKVTVLVKNTLSQNVAVCRTDYPGTESETVPLNAQPGTTSNLTCPDGDNYYKWKSASTSAQYYVNPAGVSVDNACTWGSNANPWGNYAPLNLGVGYSNGAAWLSIFQNAPTTDAKLQFTVEITGDGISGKCKYSNGQYCGGADGTACSATQGCTVSLSSGTATIVFS